MLEILVCEDKNITKDLFESVNLEYKDDFLAIRAMDKENCLGFALFSIEENVETIFSVEPKNDRMLADGLLRSALHVGCERGVTEAYYSGENYLDLYEKIDFVEDKAKHKLKLQNLFTDCCCCNKEEN